MDHHSPTHEPRHEPPAPISAKRSIREMDWQSKGRLKDGLRERCRHPRGFLTEHLVAIAYGFIGLDEAGFPPEEAQRLASIYVNNYVSAEKKAGRVNTKGGERTRPQRYYPSAEIARAYAKEGREIKAKFDRDRAAFVTADLAKARAA